MNSCVTESDSSLQASQEVAVEISRKKAKIRSAWISFAGRITAQIIGAVATVALGVVVLGKPTTLSSHPAAKAAVEDTNANVLAPVRTPGETVVAVLPLDDYSASPDHFVDGMTEALITDLSQSGQLRVISRTSAMHYKKRELPLTEVARQLGAAYVLEGSVARAGSRVRVTAQLIDARTDEHVWARSYDRAVTDSLGVQAEVAGIIASEVSGLLSQTAAPQVAANQ